LEEHKKNFYSLYSPHYEKATNTHLITDKQYADIVKIVSKPVGTKFNNLERGYRRKYQLEAM
jgi:hypothetical protein